MQFILSRFISSNTFLTNTHGHKRRESYFSVLCQYCTVVYTRSIHTWFLLSSSSSLRNFDFSKSWRTCISRNKRRRKSRNNNEINRGEGGGGGEQPAERERERELFASLSLFPFFSTVSLVRGEGGLQQLWREEDLGIIPLLYGTSLWMMWEGGHSETKGGKKKESEICTPTLKVHQTKK